MINYNLVENEAFSKFELSEARMSYIFDLKVLQVKASGSQPLFVV